MTQQPEQDKEALLEALKAAASKAVVGAVSTDAAGFQYTD